MTKTSYALFTDTIKGEKTIEVVVDTLLNKTTVFSYTGSSQEYEVPKDGYYYIEMGGAQGESNTETNKGAKTSGYIYLEAGEKLYFYVGSNNGYNGGNTSSSEFNNSTAGGATDVRLVSGNWDNTSSLISRIMVAGGGGTNSHGGDGGAGGTLYGADGVYSLDSVYTGAIANGKGGTQTSGGAAGAFNYSGTAPTAGSFGKGGKGNSIYGGNGGGGYYGGGGSGVSSLSKGGGAGGSSYISGYAGVNSVKESTTITHTNQTLHYSGKYFIGGKMLEGQNKGNGYAKITYVGEKPRRKTTKLNNVRYIKSCVNGNTTNTSNHWMELQAIKDGTNVAKGKTVTGTTTANTTYPYTYITDGSISTSTYGQAGTTGLQCITVDLEEEYNLDEIAVWNWFGSQRKYHNNVTYVSNDNSTWKEVINEASIETSNGHRINVYTDTYNGYISDNLLLWYDGYANTGATRNTTTTWKDLSGTGNNVTVSGSTWYSNYLSFDGVNDYAYRTNATYNITDEYTLEILVTPKRNTGTYQIIFNTVNHGRWTERYLSTDIGDGGFTYTISDSTNSSHITKPILDEELNKVQLVSSVLKERNLKAYSNATLYKELTADFSPKITQNRIYIGGSESAYYFQGEIYSIRVYNRALTEEELLHNYNYDIEKFNLNS